MNPNLPLPPPECFIVNSAAGWLELENSAEARQELAALPDAARQHPDVLETWWKIHAAENDWSAALESAEELARVAPDRASAWINLAFALHELKRTREAFERLSAVQARFTEEFVIPYNLACYQCQLGDTSGAWQWLKHAARVADPRRIRAMALQDPDLEPLHGQVQRLG